MCGRYTLIANLGDLAQRFEFDGSDFSYDPGYNIAPTENVLTVRNVEGREAALMRWGLVPFWAKDPKIGARMINARAETVAEKPAFRNALKRRRCLVLADGYYEWQKTPVGKRPFRIILKSGGALRHGRALGDVERPPGQRGPVLHHHHDCSQRLSCADSQQDASDPAQREGGSVAGHGGSTIRQHSRVFLFPTPARTSTRMGLDAGELRG